ncbi:MAG TPA: hypothetical protein VHM91_11870 [Verrucomicrobiales bacterium]|nr:hypothetical protein [Verrucomicrobiales bacterium]
MFPAFRVSLRLTVLCSGLLLGRAVEGHVVKQLYAKFTAGTDKWQADLNMDAGYAWPAYRDDPNSPQPTLEWLEARPPKDFAVLRQESEALLRRHLDFRGDGAPLTWTCRFPDFDSFPPDFPELLGGGAFLTVRIEGPLPPPGAKLTVSELTGQLPDFVFQTGEDQFPTLEPGKTVSLFESPPATNTPESVRAFGHSFVRVLTTDCVLAIFAIALAERRRRPWLLRLLCYITGSTAACWLVGSGTVPVSPSLIRPATPLGLVFVAAANLWNGCRCHLRLLLVLAVSLVHGAAFGMALAPSSSVLIASITGIECAAITVSVASALCFRLLTRQSLDARPGRGLNLILLLTGIALAAQRLLH